MQTKPKSILKGRKRGNSQVEGDQNSGEKNRLKWDEEKLKETELGKDAKMKISEPKTPYIHYNTELDTITGTSNSTAVPYLLLENALLDEQRANELNSNFKKATLVSSSSSAGWSDSDWDDPNRRMNEKQDEISSEDSKKSSSFDSLRKKHYNMKDIMTHARELVQNEDEIIDYSDPSKYYKSDEDLLDDEKDASDSCDDAEMNLRPGCIK